jgi:hypothetical protein
MYVFLELFILFIVYASHCRLNEDEKEHSYEKIHLSSPDILSLTDHTLNKHYSPTGPTCAVLKILPQTEDNKSTLL